MSGRVATSVAVWMLALVGALGLAACAPVAPAESATQPSVSASAESEPEPSPITDEPIDPSQQTQHTGPAIDFGGPDKGSQGLDVTDAGLWCETIALFWGGDGVPAGVTFALEGITSAPEGIVLADDQALCGDRGAEVPCVGAVLESDSPTVFCSLALQPTDGFQNGTVVGITGTLDCLTADVCATVAARQFDPGPPIVICDPAFVEQGGECTPLEG